MALVLDGPPLRGYNSYQSNTYTMDDDTQIRTPDDESAGRGSLVRSESRPMSALARGVQITEFAESRVNPTPLLLEESDILLEQYLSPGKLQNLTGVNNLELVESLELKVDSQETSLGNFGSLLPNLTELKLSGSSISSARDLGSALRSLRVLWLTRCGLEELDGISSMLNLKELYLEYNELTDISPCSMLEKLEILDLEGNNIDDITQVQYLSFCPRLRRLALDGNPICVCPNPTDEEPGYDYRQTIRKLLPNLLVLDDERLDEASSSLIKHNAFDDDWAYLEELQKDSFLQQEFSQDPNGSNEVQTETDRPTTSALRPASGYRPGSSLRPSSGFRPLSAARRPNTMSGPNTPVRPDSATSVRHTVSSDAVEGIESSSELTIGNVICGNPSKALRQRRAGGPGSKEEIRKGLSNLMKKGAIFSHSDEAEDVPLKAEDEMNNIIEELHSWKVDHEKRMVEIRKTKEAQVLVVDHDESVDVSDSEDDSDFDLPRETIDYRPGSSQRHTADLRLKKEKTPESLSYPPTSPSSEDKQSVSIKTKVPKTKERLDDHRRRVSSSDFDEDELKKSSEERSLSSASFSDNVRPQSRGRNIGDTWSETEVPSVERPRSRGQGEGGLAPLRAPSPTTAQMMSSLRARHNQTIERPQSPRSKKLRVGPTGLPNSSQTPVIRKSIAPLTPNSSRPGLIPTGSSTMSSMSKSNVALLPSQPRIARQLPETPKLLPQPPKNS